MFVAAARIELRVHGAHSLKQKRGVVKSISARVRNRFNVSVAEVDAQNAWQRAVLGLSTAACSAPAARGRLARVVDFVESLHLAEVVGQEIEIL